MTTQTLPPIDPIGLEPSPIAAELQRLETERDARRELCDLLRQFDDATRARAVVAMQRLLAWVNKDARYPATAGKRAIALLWLVRPEALDGASLSALREYGNRLGCSLWFDGNSKG